MDGIEIPEEPPRGDFDAYYRVERYCCARVLADIIDSSGKKVGQRDFDRMLDIFQEKLSETGEVEYELAYDACWEVLEGGSK